MNITTTIIVAIVLIVVLTANLLLLADAIHATKDLKKSSTKTGRNSQKLPQ